MDRRKIQQVVYGPKNLRNGFGADAYEDGCQFDHDGRHRDLGLFWLARNAQPTLNKIRIDGERS